MPARAQTAPAPLLAHSLLTNGLSQQLYSASWFQSRNRLTPVPSRRQTEAGNRIPHFLRHLRQVTNRPRGGCGTRRGLRSNFLINVRCVGSVTCRSCVCARRGVIVLD